MNEKLSYSIDDASSALGVSRQTIYRLIADQDLRTVRIRGRRIIPAAEISRLLAGSTSLKAKSAGGAP